MIIFFIIDWIIRFVTWLPFSWIFFRNHGFVLLAKFEVFMFNNPCIWCFAVCILDNCISLVIICFLLYFCFGFSSTVCYNIIVIFILLVYFYILITFIIY